MAFFFGVPLVVCVVLLTESTSIIIITRCNINTGGMVRVARLGGQLGNANIIIIIIIKRRSGINPIPPTVIDRD